MDLSEAENESLGADDVLGVSLWPLPTPVVVEPPFGSTPEWLLENPHALGSGARRSEHTHTLTRRPHT